MIANQKLVLSKSIEDSSFVIYSEDIKENERVPREISCMRSASKLCAPLGEGS